MNIIAQGQRMEASEVVKKGVELYADVETGLANAAKGLWKLHQLHDDAYLSGMITGTEAMEGKARVLQILGLVGGAQSAAIAEHVFGAGKADNAGEDIITPYAPLPPKLTRSGGGR